MTSAGPRPNPLDEHPLLLGTNVRTVDVAEDEDVEAVDRLLVLGNRREPQIAHVGAPQEDVRPGLHQRAELQVGILGQKAIDQCAVLGPQGALDVQHANARLGDRCHGRPLVVLDDLLAFDRLDADGVGVAALGGRAKLEAGLLRALRVVEGQLWGLGDLFAVLLQDRPNDAAAEPDGVDRARHLGQVVQ